MAGWFERYTTDGGSFRWRLKASNGEVILASQNYKSATSRDAGIASVQKNCGIEARYAKQTAKDGRSYFALKAGNHQIIGNSEIYNTVAARDNGIKSVMKNGLSTKIKDA